MRDLINGSLFIKVNHRLAMSRSIGDFDLKHLGVTAQVRKDVGNLNVIFYN